PATVSRRPTGSPNCSGFSEQSQSRLSPGLRRDDRGGSEGDAGTRRVGDELVARLNVARDLAAALDLDLAIANRAGNPAGGADEEALSHRQVALESAAHLDLVDRRRALEQPGFGEFDIVA